MRTFQFSDAKSHKFWSIEVAGNTITVTYGKVGTAGQAQTKSFPTAEKAAAEAEKLVREKTGKGYRETTPSAAPADEAAALEKALLADPNDSAAWHALADLLLERGDPRGEFMRVQIALEDESLGKTERADLQKKEAALLKKHERDWLGPFADFVLDKTYMKLEGYRAGKDKRKTRYRFARGWLAAVEFRGLTVEEARALVRSPPAKFLSRLEVDYTDYQEPDTDFKPGPDTEAGEFEPQVSVLCRFPHLASVRVLRLGQWVNEDYDDDYSEFNCHINGELAVHFAKQMPHAEELYLFAHDVPGKKLFALPLPRLRVLQVYHSTDYALDKLAANKSLGNLTHLLCHPHCAEEVKAYIRLSHLQAVCRSPHLTQLAHLRLRLTDFGDKGAKEIASSGVLKRLKTLDLRHGCLTDAGAKALAACPDLRRLESLDVAYNALTDAGIAALEATGVKVHAIEQHGQKSADESDDESYLNHGDIE